MNTILIKKIYILIVFDDMIADMILNKKLNSILSELFIRGRKLNISLVFISQSYFRVPKYVRVNTTHFFISKIQNEIELQDIAINHSSDISTKDFDNIYRECTAEPYSFLVNDTTLASDNPLKVLKQPSQKFSPKILTLYFIYSNLYLTILRSCCENIFKIVCIVSEKIGK